MAEETASQRTARYFRATVAFYKRDCHPCLLHFYKFIKQKNQQYQQYRETQKQIAKDCAAQEAEAIRKRQAEIEEEQAAARRAAFDPEAAIEDMRLAQSYLDDWQLNKNNHVLGLAAEYIEIARSKDPNATVVVELKGKEYTRDLNDLAGNVLFYQSQIHSYRDAPEKELKQARDLLQRALQYCPYSSQFREQLAKIHLNLHDKQSALAVANELLAAQPKSLEARKLADFVRTAPETSKPFPLSPAAIAFIILFILGGLFLTQLFSGNFTNAFELFICCVINFSVACYLGNDALLKKALDKRAREQK